MSCYMHWRCGILASSAAGGDCGCFKFSGMIYVFLGLKCIEGRTEGRFGLVGWFLSPAILPDL